MTNEELLARSMAGLLENFAALEAPTEEPVAHIVNVAVVHGHPVLPGARLLLTMRNGAQFALRIQQIKEAEV